MFQCQFQVETIGYFDTIASMAKLPRSTLEQWAVLAAVVREGSFVAAAAALHRSQSSVSYAIARLRDAVGIDLLIMDGRRAVLTSAGAALLAQATPLIEALDEVERRGAGISRGEPVRLRLLVDMLFPRQRLFAALSNFAAAYPRVDIQLVEAVRLLSGDGVGDAYDLTIFMAPTGSVGDATICEVEMRAVAAPGHPLAASRLSRPDLQSHIRADIRGAEADMNHSSGSRVWLMNTIEAAADAIRRGLCFGWLPIHVIQADLEQGTLVPLPFSTGSSRIIHLNLVLGSSEAAKSDAAAMLAQHLRGISMAPPGGSS